MRHLPSAKPERHLALITLVEEPGQVPQFDLVVAFVCARTELDLFDDDLLLLKLRLVAPLAFPVLEFAEIHDTANRGHRGRCDFHKIKLCRFRLRIGDRNRDYAHLLAVRSDQPNFRDIDFAVNARLFFLCYMKTPLYQKLSRAPEL